LENEEQLVRRLAGQLKLDGYVVALEVPVGTRSADLFCIDQMDGTTLAIEVKLKNWKRALRQAETYKLAADLVYIALPPQSVSNNCLAACASKGVGLIEVTGYGKPTQVLIAQPHGSRRRLFAQRALVFAGPSVGAAALYC
jgi:hypothetical protein